MRNITGQVVSGADFYGRKNELREIIRKIERGQCISITAPRRIGKTSLMTECQKIIEKKKSHHCIFLDLQDSASGSSLIDELLDKSTHLDFGKIDSMNIAGRKVLSKMKEIAGSIEGSKYINFNADSPFFKDDWKVRGDKIIRSLAKLNRPILIFIDELSVMLNNILKPKKLKLDKAGLEICKDILDWLKKKSVENNGKIIIVTSSSISLNALVTRMGCPEKINNLDPFKLDAWCEEDARGALIALASSEDKEFSEEQLELILNKLSWYSPYHIQLFFNRIDDYSNRNNNGCYDMECIHNSYNNELLKNCRIVFENLKTRLSDAMSASLQKRVLNFLRYLATERNLPREKIKQFFKDKKVSPEERNFILNLLEEDLYIEHDTEGNYYFVSNLIRDWFEYHQEI